MSNSVKSILQTAIVFIVLLTIVMVFLIQITNSWELNPDDYIITTYYVCAGDTLWGIAQEHCSENDDIRVWIDAVEELNGCSSNICSGQILQIYDAK